MQSFLERRRSGRLAEVRTVSLLCRGVSVLTEGEILSKQSLMEFFLHIFHPTYF